MAMTRRRQSRTRRKCGRRRECHHTLCSEHQVSIIPDVVHCATVQQPMRPGARAKACYVRLKHEWYVALPLRLLQLPVMSSPGS